MLHNFVEANIDLFRYLYIVIKLGNQILLKKHLPEEQLATESTEISCKMLQVQITANHYCISAALQVMRTKDAMPYGCVWTHCCHIRIDSKERGSFCAHVYGCKKACSAMSSLSAKEIDIVPISNSLCSFIFLNTIPMYDNV